MFRRLIAVFATALATAAVALAGPQTYATRPQTIRAGIVILDSAKSGADPIPGSAGPHVWFNLDSNQSVKPVSWTFVNPHAPARVTADIAARWSGQATAGARISKRNAA